MKITNRKDGVDKPNTRDCCDLLHGNPASHASFWKRQKLFTWIATSHLIFGGVLEAHRGLKVI
jgi:hypothetical protein